MNVILLVFFSLLESEFMPGEEFAEGGGPAAIRDLGNFCWYY